MKRTSFEPQAHSIGDGMDPTKVPTRPPPALGPYPPPQSYPEPRIAMLRAPRIDATRAPFAGAPNEPAPETPRVPPHALPPPVRYEIDERSRSSLAAVMMTPGPMIPATIPPPPSPPQSLRWVILAPCLAMLAGAAVGFGVAERTSLHAQRAADAHVATFGLARSLAFVRDTVPDASAASAAPRASTEPAQPRWTGRIVTRGAEPGHRVYVDGRVVGSTGDAFTVACGHHEVRLGTNGRPRTVAVACGAEVAVAR